jgi:alpha,alpha-trehalase
MSFGGWRRPKSGEVDRDPGYGYASAEVWTGMTDLPDPGRPLDPWRFEYEGYEPETERRREALCTVGNGRFATRGAAPEADASEHHYPGTYVAGLYNRLSDEISGREIFNESLVNVPNWLPLTFRVDDGAWFSIDDVEILSYRQTLELRRGVLVRRVRFRDGDGRTTSLAQRRLVSMAEPNLAALETSIRAEDWSGAVTVRSTIDGSVRNRGVKRYSQLSDRHLRTLEREQKADDTVMIRSRTTQSRVEVVVAARTRMWIDGDPCEPEPRLVDPPDGIGVDLCVHLHEGSDLCIEKVVALHTSRDLAISEPWEAAEEALERAGDFEALERTHVLAWDQLWRRFDIDLQDHDWTKLVTNLHVFHLLQTTSPNSIGRDVGIPARGLHGEAYRGHIFWDELFIFPMLTMRVPEIAQSLLGYRFRRLPAARRAAASAGYDGAMFPWQSGSDGTEESQVLHLNPESGNWIPDATLRQRHINIAIAYNAWMYFLVTWDVDFLARYGAEMFLEIARFWASIAERNPVTDRYEIVGVMGPDEFHTADPGWDGEGLRNNAYTNVMVSWLFATAPKVLEPLPKFHRIRLTERLGLMREEIERWDEISRKLFVPFHDGGIISQFEGYERLEEFDWDVYRERYGDIQRLDRILDAEGDTPNRYKVSKQADVLMLFYLLSFEEMCEVFGRLGIAFDEQMLQRNVDYYLARTSHGSTLSGVVHSWVLARTDRRRSMELFTRALEADVTDVQDGTTEEGIHLGAMAGSVDLLERGYSGIEFRDDVLRFKPSLPDEIRSIGFRIYYRGRWLHISLEDDQITVESEVTDRRPIDVECRGERRSLGSGGTATFVRSSG